MSLKVTINIIKRRATVLLLFLVLEDPYQKQKGIFHMTKIYETQNVGIK